MPPFADPAPDERGQLLAFLDVQRQAVRAAISGLDDAAARRTPSASSISLAALLKHLLVTERRWVVAAVANRPAGLWPVQDWDAEWQLTDEDTVEALLARYAEVAEETAAVLADVGDLGAPCPLPDCAQWSVRWVVLHILEETARHAGHADVIRESLDGAHAPQLDS